MKPTRVGDNWSRFDDGTYWALPPNHDDDGPTLEWVQRYGSNGKIIEQRMCVASVLGCYEALLMLTDRERNARVKAIREAMKMRDAQTKGGIAPREASE